MLCAFKNFITVGGSWNRNLRIKPLQRSYFDNSGGPASACVMRRNYSIAYTDPLHDISGLLAVGRVENTTHCGLPSFPPIWRARVRSADRSLFLVEVFRFFFLNCKTNSAKFSPHSSPDIVGHHNHKKIVHYGRQ